MSVKERLIGLSSSNTEPYPVQIVGEASYRNNIEKICGNYDEEEGYHDDSHVAAVYLEDDNPHDPNNAIRIAIDDLTVGYLSKTDAATYRKRLTSLNAPVNAIGICAGSIGGGFRKRNGEIADFGIRLDFDLKTFTLTRVRFENEWIYPPGASPKADEKINMSDSTHPPTENRYMKQAPAVNPPTTTKSKNKKPGFLHGITDLISGKK